MTDIKPSQEPPKPILEEPIDEDSKINNPLLASLCQHIEIANKSYAEIDNIQFKVMEDMLKDKKWIDDTWRDQDVYRSSDFCMTLRGSWQKCWDIIYYQEIQVKTLKETINKMVKEVKSARIIRSK